MKTILFVVGYLLSIEMLLGQHFCITYTKQQELFEKHPHLIEKSRQDEIILNQTTYSKQGKTKINECYEYVIPVVFHILHNNGPENISDEIIKNQIRRLNLDFNKRNNDTVDIVSEFKSIAGNTEVEFRLAKIDPNGNPTNGIVRYVTTDTYDPEAFVQIGRQWPREKYMNIYVMSNVGEGVAGYTFLPIWVDGWPEGDAIFMKYSYVSGDSRVLTHEVGHWLNLNHCWGPSNEPGLASNCSADDGVFDTPNTVGWQICNINGSSCGSPIDNVQNYMEYTFCNNMFTNGQVARMHNTLNSSISDRNNLWQSSNLIATGTSSLSEAKFSVSQNVVCVGQPVYLYDESTYGACEWFWLISGNETYTSAEQYPMVIFNEPGLYQVSLTASNSTSSVSVSETNVILVTSPYDHFLPFSENFESASIPGSNWISKGVSSNWMINNDASVSETKSVYLNNFSIAPGEIHSLTSAVDLSVLSSANITFKVAYARKTTTDNEVMRLLMSDDCGENWQLRWGRVSNSLKTAPETSSNFIPDSTQWATYQVNIPSNYLKENFQFQFEFRSNGGNNVYLDDINISGTYHSYPILLYPENNSVITTTQVELDWKSLDTANFYVYELDTTMLFNSPLLVSGTNPFISSYPHNSDTKILVDGLLNNTNYFWRIKSDAGIWSDVWKFTTDTLSSITSHEFVNGFDQTIKVFPTITQQYIHIDFKNTETIQMFAELWTIQGSLLKAWEIQNNHTLDISNFSEGFYVLQLYNPTSPYKKLTYKIVKGN